MGKHQSRRLISVDRREQKSVEIKLIDPKELAAWSKNPRDRDPERFEWIKVSLSKFGFVMPIFIRDDGVLYSGHQRTGAALELGFEEVPVVVLPHTGSERMERAMNVLFNLCTNDHLTKSDFGKKAAMELQDLEQFKLLPDASDKSPCLQHFNISPIKFLDQLTPDRINNMTKLFAESLISLGAEIPILLDENDNIINGAPRLLAAISMNRLSYPAVRITENVEALTLFVNKITMSFDLKKAFGEELRYNSFFRRRNQAAQRVTFGVGFYQWVFGKDARDGGKQWLMKHMVKLEGEYLQRFIAEHGTTCVDFGAGRLDNTVKLQAAGLTCIPFEPFNLKPNTDEISVPASRMIAKRFLKWIANCPRIDSVFCSSVFNSVPFKQDRDYLMVIFQAMCLHGARLYLHTLSDSTLGSRVFNNGLNEASRSDGAILLDSEPGLYINEILNVAKVQKFHSKEELMSLGRKHFQRVKYSPANSASHGIKCEGSKQIDWVELIKALEFEFDLPYPGDLRMGLADEAIEAFSKFTGQDLVAIRKTLCEATVS
ncbi:MAG: ParB N-terminal domain-containing protein [Leptolyngbya sp. Prado105]|jgi:hypothetical protein|nr:ParB N-terminal domain-containing protein [Leptolyngbya sp. Prado105]